jgi:hypothetical protein
MIWSTYGRTYHSSNGEKTAVESEASYGYHTQMGLSCPS